MFAKIKNLKGFTLNSLDGEIGKVKEFYFDDRHWTIRYLVADTGNWLPGRQVLISPYALGGVTEIKQQISVDLTQKQIEESPSLASDKPVSRQFEEQYFNYFQWPFYWNGPYVWGVDPFIIRDWNQRNSNISDDNNYDFNLRSTNKVRGYHIQATDGEIGHVDDFIIDDDTWSIRYLEIDTSNWWIGKKVLVSPEWIHDVSWEESQVSVSLSRESVKNAPEYTDWSILTREFEMILHKHYNRKGYWESEPKLNKQPPE